MDNLKPTPAIEWRVKTELVMLPSGRTAEFKKLNIVSAISDGGSLPSFFRQRVVNSLNGKSEEAVTFDETNISDVMESARWLAQKVFVYPKLVFGDPVADNEVDIADLDQDDIIFAFNYAMGGGTANDVKRFPGQQS